MKNIIEQLKSDIEDFQTNTPDMQKVYKERIERNLGYLTEENAVIQGFYDSFRKTLTEEVEKAISDDELSFGEETGLQRAIEVLDKAYAEHENPENEIENETELSIVNDIAIALKKAEKLKNGWQIKTRSRILIQLIDKYIQSDIVKQEQQPVEPETPIYPFKVDDPDDLEIYDNNHIQVPCEIGSADDADPIPMLTPSGYDDPDLLDEPEKKPEPESEPDSETGTEDDPYHLYLMNIDEILGDDYFEINEEE